MPRKQAKKAEKVVVDEEVDLTRKDYMVDIKRDVKGKINLNLKIKDQSLDAALLSAERLVYQLRARKIEGLY